MNWHLKTFEELTIKELYELFRVRIEVFVVEQDCPYQDADGKDFKSYHLFAEKEGEVFAYSRIVPPGVSYKEASIGRVISSEKARGTGLGITLMEKSVEECLQLFGENIGIRISAQEYLIKFYQKFGFEQVGEGYLEDNIPHVQMFRP